MILRMSSYGWVIQPVHAFLRPGGHTEFTNNATEFIYYIVDGEMTLKTDDEETLPRAGDSFHCGPGTNKSVTNTGNCCTRMLVVLHNPKGRSMNRSRTPGFCLWFLPFRGARGAARVNGL